jgi:hypothetical protein
MADIFISYARADRTRAEKLAHVLGQHGWSVWWDRFIPPGKTFDEVIEEALSSAKCVIVLWSHDSVKSEWVKAEASDAAQRHILVPILADEVTIPLEFRRIQTARLIDWENLPANRGWEELSHALAALMGREIKTSIPAVPARQPARRSTVTTACAAIGVVLAVAGYFGRQRVIETKPMAPLPATSVVPPRDDNPVALVPLVNPKTEAPPRGSTTAPRELSAAKAATIAEPPTANRPTPRQAASNAAEAVAVAAAPPPIAATTLPTEHVPPHPTHSDKSTFDVTYTHGVFREESGRLTVSSSGVRYEETASSAGARAAFEVPCEDVRKVETLNVIADGKQRMLELRVRERSYRLGTADTATRDGIVAALSRTCGPR